MKPIETSYNDQYSSTRFFKQIVLLVALIGGCISSAQADLTFTGITQSPQNNVMVDQSVTYEITVTHSGAAANESPTITVSDNGVDVTSYFFSQQCNSDGALYCNAVSTVSVFTLNWTPPAEGTHNVVFNMICAPDCNGDQISVTTIVGNSTAPEQPPVANAGADQSVTDTNNDGTELVTLDASATTDANNNIAYYEWFEGNQSLGRGVNLQVDLPVGVHTITLDVWDNAENLSSDEVVVTVVAGEPDPGTGPGIETIAGDNQRLLPDQQSDPLSIQVFDTSGQPAAGVTVAWSVIPADAATLTSSSTQTDSSGVSSNTVTPTSSRPGSAFKVVATTTGALSARFTVNPLAGISGLTTAQRSIAGALDNACPALQSQTRVLTTEEQGLLTACDFLAAASDQDIASTLQQFLPAQIAAQGRNSLSLGRIRNKNILHRMQALRSGMTGPSLEQLSLSIQGEQLPSILISELNRAIRGGGASADEADGGSRLGMFVNGNVSIGDTETTAREAGFDLETSGLTLGIDYRYTDRLVFGGAFNYLSNDSDYTANASTLDLDGYSLSAYGTYYYSEQVFVDGILSLGSNRYDSTRNFLAAGTTHSLSGETDGSEQALTLGAGYEMHAQNLTFVPQGRISYLRFKIDSYDELSSGSGVNLHIDEQEVESLTTSLSANLSMAYSTLYGVFVPYLSIEWAHEFNNDSRAIVARFVNDPSLSSFSVLSDDPDRDFFNLGLGVTATLTNGKSAFLHYEHLLGYADSSQYTLTGGFRLEF